MLLLQLMVACLTIPSMSLADDQKQVEGDEIGEIIDRTPLSFIRIAFMLIMGGLCLNKIGVATHNHMHS